MEIKIAENTYTLLGHVSSFVGSLKRALEDGWQPGSDIPAILSAAITDLAPAVFAMGAVANEYENDRDGFYKAVGCAMVEMVEALAVKKEA